MPWRHRSWRETLHVGGENTPEMAMPFIDRADAGRRLAMSLEHLRGADVVVLGLPRGGVPVAFEVARALGAPLDVIVVRKLGVPFQPELAMGAVGEGGARVVDEQVQAAAGVDAGEFAAVEARERAELERRVRRFRGERPPVPVAGRIAIVVDDGIATGSTARAACQVARAHGASRVVLAVPVAPPGTVAALGVDADEVVCVETPASFFAIGQFYDDFSQTDDSEVMRLLDTAARLQGATGSPPVEAAHPDRRHDLGRRDDDVRDDDVRDDDVHDDDVVVPVGPDGLSGHLTVPAQPTGLVVFAHGSGSSRNSPRNRFVASVLNGGGLATLLFDLLTPAEELDRANVFDIAVLGNRLVEVTRWLRTQSVVPAAPVGYFGASTGAGAALWAAAQPDAGIDAVVSRGGRPDLATGRLALVRAPTLLIVGGRDDVVLDLNRRAQEELRCEHRLEVIPGATHLFEEPGTLEAAASAARRWFTDHMPAP